jgi:aconitate hydratase
VLAESFERIHRSNLVGMGVFPIQFREGDSAESLGLTGRETLAISGLEDGPSPGQEVRVAATREDGSQRSFSATLRVDSPGEVEYVRAGGILQMVLHQMLG